MSQLQGEERRVVPFAAPPGRMRRRFVEDTTGRGAILLFTGVRYERPALDAVVPVSQDRPAPARDPRLDN